jgi:hypothetical protein
MSAINKISIKVLRTIFSPNSLFRPHRFSKPEVFSVNKNQNPQHEAGEIEGCQIGSPPPPFRERVVNRPERAT